MTRLGVLKAKSDLPENDELKQQQQLQQQQQQQQ
jgi:hypothetical protein